MSNRKSDIIMLIEKSKKMYSTIEIKYKNSLDKKNIDPNLKIDIKNYCENVRSSLDYLAKEIVFKYCPTANKNDNLYFPICKSKSIFDNKMKKSYPNLDENNKSLYDYLENIQSFNNLNNQWLMDFNTLTNENKHEKLVEQTRIETKQVNVKFNSGNVS